MNMVNIDYINHKSSLELSTEERLSQCLASCPLPEDQILENLGLFLSSKNLSRILFMDHIYKQIVDVPGIVLDLGTRWGHNLVLYSALRGIYEPFHRHRKLVGFDTFEGFPNVDTADGNATFMKPGGLGVTQNYAEYLNTLMEIQEELNPLSHIKKFEVVSGDITATLPNYIDNNPETIIALVYFDLNLYQPTKSALETIKDRLVQGSILAFDELNDHDAPGETLAVLETFGLNNIELKRFPYASRSTYFVVK